MAFQRLCTAALVALTMFTKTSMHFDRDTANRSVKGQPVKNGRSSGRRCGVTEVLDSIEYSRFITSKQASKSSTG
ncbi:hypothetical protein DFH08DRAFT_828829 [Mycena albidolilacea]|uniref:Secreted protein n=1 Tax=Mycena albidolilacea TaxID=1033008 RepID=A0AAD7AT67_9AGAR|nr:hypothetical protein DFH08DRAFT_828829 [Mycena albidolilacea]